jgi:hypothetical protein
MQSNTSSALTCTAKSPFDDPTTDFILRSCDDVDFRVNKGFLSAASPVFEDLLGMLHTPDDSAETDVPFMKVTEDQYVLDALLRFCLPGADPLLPSPRAIADVLEASRKYELVGVKERLVNRLRAWISACDISKATVVDFDSIMEMEMEYELSDIRVREQIQDVLISNLKICPLRIFLLAYRYKLGKIARCAAKYTLRIGVTGLEAGNIRTSYDDNYDFTARFAPGSCLPIYSNAIPANIHRKDLEELPCGAFLRLLKYHGDCRNVALACTSNPTHKIQPERRTVNL